jgi:hypothetical protein
VLTLAGNYSSKIAAPCDAYYYSIKFRNSVEGMWSTFKIYARYSEFFSTKRIDELCRKNMNGFFA